MPRRSVSRVPLLAALLFAPPIAAGEADGNWPRFRGPHANGVVPGESLPTVWDGASGEHVKWRVPIPGEGWSQPIVVGDAIFLTTAVLVEQPAESGADRGRRGRYRGPDLTSATYRYELHKLNADTGATEWVRVARTGSPPLLRHRTNTYATETPVADGERVYALFGLTGLYAFTLEGEPVWEKELEPRPMRAGWGTAASPALHGGRLFLQTDSQGASDLAALDAATGEELWRIEREEPSSYGSPVVWETSAGPQLVAGGQTFRGHDPATGEELWRLDMALGRHSSTPVPVGDTLLIGTEYRDRGGDDDGGGYVAAIAADARGDLGSVADGTPRPGVRWATERGGIQMASAAVAGGRIHFFERRGAIAHVLDFATGEKLLKARVPAAGPFWASPLVSGERVYALDENGATHVLDATGPADQLTILARNELGDRTSRFWATPAAGRGRLYVRGEGELICIGE